MAALVVQPMDMKYYDDTKGYDQDKVPHFYSQQTQEFESYIAQMSGRKPSVNYPFTVDMAEKFIKDLMFQQFVLPTLGQPDAGDAGDWESQRTDPFTLYFGPRDSAMALAGPTGRRMFVVTRGTELVIQPESASIDFQNPRHVQALLQHQGWREIVQAGACGEGPADQQLADMNCLVRLMVELRVDAKLVCMTQNVHKLTATGKTCPSSKQQLETGRDMWTFVENSLQEYPGLKINVIDYSHEGTPMQNSFLLDAPVNGACYNGCLFMKSMTEVQIPKHKEPVIDAAYRQEKKKREDQKVADYMAAVARGEIAMGDTWP